jgi:hypothetical protein
MAKMVVGIIGTGFILVGLALLILPGPGILLILTGLAVLSLEFPWASNIIASLKKWWNRPS